MHIPDIHNAIYEFSLRWEITGTRTAYTPVRKDTS